MEKDRIPKEIILALTAGVVTLFTIFIVVITMAVQPKNKAIPKNQSQRDEDAPIPANKKPAEPEKAAEQEYYLNKYLQSMPVCYKYLFEEVEREDLFEYYTVEKPESIREIARKLFGDYSYAENIKEANTDRGFRNITAPLPTGTRLKIPDGKYYIKNINKYFINKGNIVIEDTKKRFSVISPTAAAGFYDIDGETQDLLEQTGVTNGDCIILKYGQEDSSNTKHIFEVSLVEE
jgi:hypothetical protein